MDLYVGIDAGGTKTAAVVGDKDGNIIGTGVAGAGNPLSVGIIRTVENVISAINNGTSSIKSPYIVSVYIGMAGGKKEIRKKIIKRLRLSPELRNTKHIYVDHDLRTALYSGSPDGEGIVLIVGTGSCAFGFDKNGSEVEVSGWNHWLGETGGYELGIKAILAATRDHDGRGPKTILKKMIINALQLERLEDISIIIKSPTIDSPKIASLSPIVIEAAKKKDGVARKIVEDMVQEMNDSIHAAYKRIEKKGTLSIVLAGGMFKSDIPIIDSLKRKLSKWNSNFKLILPTEPPSTTAYKFALRKLSPEKIVCKSK